MVDEMPKRKKLVSYLIYTAAAVAFVAVAYALLTPSGGADDERGKLNGELPEGEADALPDSKATAYEDLARHGEAQLRGLGADELSVDLAALGDSARAQDSVQAQRAAPGGGGGDVSAAVTEAREVARALQGSRGEASARPTPAYEERGAGSGSDSERSRQKLEELKIRNEQAQQATLQMMQAQQAALQMMQAQQAQPLAAGISAEEDVRAAAAEAESVSAIPDGHGDVATTLGGSRRRSGGFYGMSGREAQQNSIKACAYGEQVVGDGQNLRLRLLEPMLVGSQVLPVGSILTGTCRIGVDRLLVSVMSVELAGIITRVSLDVYDSDGQQGLYVPGSMEMEAAREVGAEVASAVGSTAGQQVSMFSQQSAAEQIKADVGRGVLQGTFRFLGRKLREVKIQVQDKHRVFLVPQK
jgi:conjugative transposon TraM protein